MSIELTISIKDEEKRKLTKEFLIYEPITLTPSDPIIDGCVKEMLSEFKGTPDDIRIKATMVLQ